MGGWGWAELFSSLQFGRRQSVRAPPCAVKTCAVRPVLVRVVEELRAADPGKCPRAHEAKCQPRGAIWGSETKVEAGAGAARRTRKPGQSAHAETTQGVVPWDRTFQGGTSSEPNRPRIDFKSIRKRFEKHEKDQKNDPKCHRKSLSPSHAALKFLTGTVLKVFHRPKFAQECFFLHRAVLQG